MLRSMGHALGLGVVRGCRRWTGSAKTPCNSLRPGRKAGFAAKAGPSWVARPAAGLTTASRHPSGHVGPGRRGFGYPGFGYWFPYRNLGWSGGLVAAGRIRRSVGLPYALAERLPVCHSALDVLRCQI
jgi:hypothetical protein